MIGVMRDDRSLLELILGDGRGLIAVVGLALVLSGGFAILQSASGHLLRHDSQAIGMTPWGWRARPTNDCLALCFTIAWPTAAR